MKRVCLGEFDAPFKGSLWKREYVEARIYPQMLLQVKLLSLRAYPVLGGRGEYKASDGYRTNG